MTLTSDQFGFLAKEKVFKKNTPITVERNRNVVVSESYKVPQNELIDGYMIGYKHEEVKSEYTIGYTRSINNPTVYCCKLEQVKAIDGQDVDRYYKSYIDIIKERNAIVFEEPTNITKLIGKMKGEINGVQLYEGMKFVCKQDKIPSYNNITLNVKLNDNGFKFVKNVGRPKTKDKKVA